MGRLARVIVPGYPHHVTQRGNRRQRTFFCDMDYRLYIRLMRESCARHAVKIWAYCLMPNHTHLIAVPENDDGMRLAIGEAHYRYTLQINSREGWKGHLWQGRFSSFPMDEPHLLAAARYIELNPVAAGLADAPGEYPWSSAKAHLWGLADGLTAGSILTEMVENWEDFLAEPLSAGQLADFKKHCATGRPMGSEAFICKLEKTLGRLLHKGKPGPKPRGELSRVSP